MSRDLLREIGMLALTARIRRLSDQVTHDVLHMYKREGVAFDLRYAPILTILHRRERILSSEISETLGVTKSAVSQTIADMLKDGLIEEAPVPGDRRKKLLTLTDKGQAFLAELLPVWDKAEAVFHQFNNETGHDLPALLTVLEGCLKRKTLMERYDDLHHSQN